MSDERSFVEEANKDRAEIVENIAKLNDNEKSEAAITYATTLAAHIHSESKYSFLTTDDENSPDVDTSTGLIKSKNPEALAEYMLNGYHRDRCLEQFLTKDQITQGDVLNMFAIITAPTLADMESIMTDPTSDNSIQARKQAQEFIKEYSGGLKTDSKYSVGCGGAYGRQMQPLSKVTGKYKNDIYPNSHLSRLMLHTLNYGGISEDGTLNTQIALPDFEMHIADQPFDPLFPPEYAPEKFFEAIRKYNEVFSSQTLFDAEVIDLEQDEQNEVVYSSGPLHFHGPLSGHQSVTTARLRLLSQRNLRSPMVVHVEEAPSPDGNTNYQTRLIEVAKAAIEHNSPIVIENNRYLNEEGQMIYHNGVEFAQILKQVINDTYAELSQTMPENELKKRISDNIGVTIDVAHLHCSPPHLGSPPDVLRGQLSPMLTASEKRAQTLESVETILNALDEIAEDEPGIRLKHLNLHVTQNRDRGKDIHMATLLGAGTVPNKDAFQMISTWAETRKVQVHSILEQSGNVRPDEVTALTENKETAIEMAGKIVPIEVLADNPDLLNGKIKKLENCNILAIDVPEYTIANGMSEELAQSMHALVIHLRQELAGMVDSGPYGEAFIANAIGDEIMIGLNASADKDQNEMRAFLLALDSQVIFWKLLDMPQYASLKKELYQDDTFLHCGIAADKNIFVETPTVDDKLFYITGGSAMSVKRSSKTIGLAKVVEAHKKWKRSNIMAREFYNLALQEPEPEFVDTIVGTDEAVETQMNRLIAWRNEIAGKINVPPLKGLEVQKFMQSDEYENAKETIAHTLETTKAVENQVLKDGSVLFGRISGFEQAYEQIRNNMHDPELADLAQFIATSEVGKTLLTQLSESDWDPREVECDYSEGELGLGNFVATKGILSDAQDRTQNTAEIVTAINTLKTTEQFDILKDTMRGRLVQYLADNRNLATEEAETLANEALTYFNKESLNVVVALEELGDDRYAIVENVKNRHQAHVGAPQISGNILPITARMAFGMLKNTQGTESLVVSSNLANFPTQETDETEIYLKGIGQQKIAYVRC